VIGYAGVIFFFSSQPAAPRYVPHFFGADKLLHAIEYCGFGFLLTRAFRSSLRGKALGKGGFLLILGIVLLYGVSDEFHQAYVPNREASVWDVMADVVGGGLGFFLAARILSGRDRHD